MPRTTARLQIEGRLVAQSPLHVGGMGGNADVDLALAENGAGKLYVPGTSLTGPLRAWLYECIGSQKVEQLWGYQSPPPRDRKEAWKRREKKEDELGWASFVIVEDGQVILPSNAEVEIRDGVGIDRYLGRAAERAKYERAVLPKGTVISLKMTVDYSSDTEPDTKSIIGALLKALQGERVRFGAARSRGLGRVKLTDLNLWQEDFATPQGIIAFLRGEHTALTLADLGSFAEAQEPASIKIAIDWQPRGALMVKAAQDGLAVDMLPLVSATQDRFAFVLPGSSIKGALRSHAERIVRTLFPTLPTPREGKEKDAFLKQLEIHEVDDEDVEYRRSLLGAMFGAAGKRESQDEIDDDDLTPLLGASAITIEDCYARSLFTQKQWATVTQAKEMNELLPALQEAGLASAQPAFHVAVDRWTGGAAEGALYTVLEPHGMAWNEMQLSLKLARLREDEHLAALACLLLVLRDFSMGLIPLGFGVNRGMGAVQINHVKFTTSGLENDPLLSELQNLSLSNGRIHWTSQHLRDTLNQAWANWRAFAAQNYQKGNNHE